MVTVEAAVVLPLLAMLVLTLMWMVSLGIAQVRLVDAARDSARELARGSDPAVVEQAARRSAPAGATVSTSASGDAVEVTVAATADPPGWLLVPFPGVDLSASAVVAVEPDE